MATIPTFDENSSLNDILSFITNLQNEMQLASGDTLLTESVFNSRAQELKNAFQQPFPSADVAIDSSGDLAVPHLGKVTVLNVDTYGQAASDDLNNINPDTSAVFTTGDVIILFQASPARQVNITTAGNLDLNGGSKILRGLGEFMALMYSPTSPGNRWKEIGRFPQQAALFGPPVST